MASTAHGGYLFRLERLSASRLTALAKEALVLEREQIPGTSIQVSLVHPARIVRLAYRARFTDRGNRARWYLTHHALARLLSSDLSSAVHVYALDPQELEEVTSYGKGRRVGGERLEYDQLELPEGEDGVLSEAAFYREKQRWPLGHLARILGVERRLLESIPELPKLPLSLDQAAPASAWDLLFRQATRASPVPRRSLP
jgi:hypothetical protein